MMNIKNFNVRQMQAYAALCLFSFCDKLGIKHAGIDELILHMFNILVASDLAQWEQAGASLLITGRGDLLPLSVEKAISKEKLKPFNSLVELCVEVGLVDMYGDVTEQPYVFLKKCIKLIESYDIPCLTPEHLDRYGRGALWGEAINESELKDIFEAYGVNLS